jgi:competence protein ComEA
MATPARANSLLGYIVISLVWLAVFGILWFVVRRPAPQPVQVLPPPTVAPTATLLPTSSPSPLPAPRPIRVDVAGAVQNPGVYRIPAGSIVVDAIAAAGGPAPGAALQRLNKAASLQDGMQVYVPLSTETALPTPLLPVTAPATAPSSDAGSLPAASSSGRASAQSTHLPGQSVDLNQATLQDLEALPGIGPALAQRILAARPYSSVDDLDRVSGIGPAILEKLKPYVIVR